MLFLTSSTRDEITFVRVLPIPFTVPTIVITSLLEISTLWVLFFRQTVIYKVKEARGLCVLLHTSD